MIKRIKHKGLKRLYEKGDSAAVGTYDVRRLRQIVARLDEAGDPEDMDLPGLHLHRLRGNRKNTWGVTVRANYRVTWKVDRDGAFVDVDYEDYH